MHPIRTFGWRNLIVTVGAFLALIVPFGAITPTASAARVCPDVQATANPVYHADTDRCTLSVVGSPNCPDGWNQTGAAGRTINCDIAAINGPDTVTKDCPAITGATGAPTYDPATDKCRATLNRGANACPDGWTRVNQGGGGLLVCEAAPGAIAAPVVTKDCPDIVGATRAPTYDPAADKCNATLNRGATECPAGWTSTGQAGGLLTCQAAPGAGPAAGADDAADDDKDENADDCPIKPGTDFRWAMCPVFYAFNEFTQVLDGFIDDYMTTGNDIFDGTNAGYQNAWTVFRNISLGLVVLAGLVMLVSEALGISLFDAYTVRKVLPRLFVAIIGITISWTLCRWLVGFFDDLGHAIGSVIYTAFQADQLNGGNTISVGSTIVQALLGGAGVATAAALLLTGGGVLSLLGTLLMAMLVGAAVLVIRQAVIVATVLLSPLAIAAYILPNTSKLAHFWWDTLTRMLALYPIATGLIALCKVLGAITMNNPADGAAFSGVIAIITGMVFFFAGYALLPVAFRLAGGMVATLGGMANDRSRGFFDKQKKKRGELMAGARAAEKAGNRFTGKRWIPGSRTAAKGFNMGSASVGTGLKGHYGIGQRGVQARDQVRRNASAELKKSAAFQAIQNDDDALMAASYSDAGAAQKAMTARIRQRMDSRVQSGEITSDQANQMAANDAKRAVSAIESSIGFGNPQAIAAAEQMVSTGTGYNDLQDMTQTLARASGGSSSTATALAGFANSATKAVGRHDLAPGFGKLNDLVQGTLTNDGTRANDQKFMEAGIEAARSTDNATLLRNKPKSVENMTTALSQGLEQAHQTMASPTSSPQARAAAEVTAGQISAKLGNMRDSGMYGPEVNVEKIHVAGTIPSQRNERMVSEIVAPTIQVSSTDVNTRETVTTTQQNPAYSPRAADTYASQRSARGNSQDARDSRLPE